VTPTPQPVEIPDHELVRLIAEGAYGEVWLARSVMGQYRAVKIVRRDRFGSDRPFEREFSGIERFEPISRTHESQLDILHIGRHEGYFYTVMEVADDTTCGQQIVPDNYAPHTLSSDLLERGRLPFEECLDIALALTTALDHLHDHGLVHRDIKPSNVIFVNGRPKLADIGLVARTDASMTLVGTEGYLAPEGPGKPAADLYSLGKVIYEIATGRDRNEFPELPTDLEAFVGDEMLIELNEIIGKATAPSLKDRYATAGQMLEDLRQLQAGRSIRRLRKAERRVRLLIRASVVGTICLLIATGGYLFQRRQVARANRSVERLHSADAAQALIEDDLFRALDSSVKALEYSAPNSHRERVQRLRIQSILDHCPRILAVLPHEGPVNYAEFSPDDSLVVTANQDGAARIWDAGTGELRQTLRHEGPVAGARFSPNGQYILTVSADLTARLWDSQSGRAVSPSLRHDAKVNSGDFDSEGKRVATASMDGRVRVWEAPSGKLRFELEHPGPVGGVKFSPDSTLLLSGSEDPHLLHLWNTSTGEPVTEPIPHDGWPGRVEFGPEGKLFVASSGGALTPWHWQKVTQVRSVATGQPISPELVHIKPIQVTIFSPDGLYLLTADTEGTAWLREAKSGRPAKRSFQHDGPIWDAHFSPDGLQLATASADATVRLWDVLSLEQLCPPLPHGGQVMSCRFSHDGLRLVTGSKDHIARIWSVTPESRVWPKVRHRGGIRRAKFSPDGKLFATISNEGTAGIWETETGLPVGGPLLHEDAWLYDVEWTPDSGRIVTGALDGKARLWSTSGDLLQVYDVRRGETNETGVDRIIELAISKNGKTLATSSYNGSARLWDLDSGKPISKVLRHSSQLLSIDIDPAGQRIITGGQDGRITGWSVSNSTTPEHVIEVEARVSHVEFSPTGESFAVGCDDGACRQYASNTGQVVTPPLAHGGAVRHLTFSSDGNRLATASHDRMARIWDTSTGQLVCPPLRHDREVVSVSFSPDDRFLVTASYDYSARVWDAVSGEPVTPALCQREAISYAEFSPDGSKILTSGGDGMAKVWSFRSTALAREHLLRLMSLHDAPLSVGQSDSGIIARELEQTYRHLRRTSPGFLVLDHSKKTQGHATYLDYAWQSSRYRAARFHASFLEDSNLAPHSLAEIEQRIAATRIPLRAPDTPVTAIDLSSFYNVSLNENSYAHWPGEGNDFAQLPKGIQTLGGTAFDVRGIIQLTGDFDDGHLTKPFPPEVSGIPVERRAKHLHFLHASLDNYHASHGQVLGWYVIHFANGSTHRIPVRFGHELRGWWNYDEHFWPEFGSENAQIVWQGLNAATENSMYHIRLFKFTWNNPKPEERIESIDLVSALPASPLFVVAVTADP